MAYRTPQIVIIRQFIMGQVLFKDTIVPKWIAMLVMLEGLEHSFVSLDEGWLAHGWWHGQSKDVVLFFDDTER